MTADHDAPPLPSHLMAKLEASAPPSGELETRTLRELQRNHLLGSRATRAAWRWLPQAIAASLLFAAGVAVGRGARPTVEPPVTVATPSERLEGAALRYLAALDAAPLGDSVADLVAVASFRAAAQQVMARFPDQNVSLALSVSFAEGSLIPPGVPGKKEHTVWF